MFYLFQAQEIYDDNFGPRQPNIDGREEKSHVVSEEDEHVARVQVDERVKRQIPVHEFADSMPEGAENENEDEDSYISEVEQMLITACKCKKQKACYTQFLPAQVLDHILNVKEMDKSEKELYILDTLVANSSDSETTRRGVRKQTHLSYKFDGKVICRGVYRIVFDVGEKYHRNLLKHMKVSGAAPRTHGNKGKKPPHALAVQDMENAVQFIKNFAEENAIPASPLERDDITTVVIHSSHSKKNIHKLYVSSCEEGQRSVKYKTFISIWRSCCQHIKIARPQDDVCGTTGLDQQNF